MKQKTYKKKLPEKIQLALALYYINRANKGQRFSFSGSFRSSTNGERVYEMVEHTKSTWNKAQDFDRVCLAAQKFGYSTQACAGTFWFNKGKKCFRISESTFPLAENT